MAAAGKKKSDDERFIATVDVIAMLTGFATYDALARAGHGEEEIIAMITRLAHSAAT
jgi:general stress protein CsbA